MTRSNGQRAAMFRLIGSGVMALSAVALSAALADPASSDKPAAAGKVMGFAVTNFPFALYKGADDCPDGPVLSAKDIYLKSVSPAEQKRLQLAENLKEFEQKAYHTADGRDVCEVLDLPREPQRSPKGKISYGMNLDGTKDGAATANSCAHEKFTSPDGEVVDNQTYRVMGCMSNYRGPPGESGYLESLRNSGFKDGGTTFLIELMGVKDPKNDNDIQVGIYNGTSQMAVDPSGSTFLPYASLTVTDDKRWQSVVHGRIVNGVVMTDPGDIALTYVFGGAPRDYHIKAARLRLEIQPDGKAKGMLAGYMDMADVDMTKGTKQASAEMVKYDCPSIYQAIRRYADGYKDPNTGKCTALSTAFQVEAIPAFIIHPEEAKKTAQATTSTETR